MRRYILPGAIALLLYSATAYALSIKVSSGGNTFTCADGDACDTDSAAGVVHSSTTLNGTTISINTTGIGLPAIGALAVPDLDDTSAVVTSGEGDSTFLISVSQEGFLPPFNAFVPLTFQAGGTTQGNVSFTAYGGRPEFDLSQQIAHLGVFTDGPFSGSTTGVFDASDPFALIVPYSLTVVAEVTHHGGSEVSSFDAELFSAVPEPSTFVLVGLGLIGLARKYRTSLTV